MYPSENRQEMIEDKKQKLNEIKASVDNSAPKFYVPVLVIIIAAAIGIILFMASSSISDKAFVSSYNDKKNIERQATYDKYKETAFNYAEQKYHTSNRSYINITGIKEKNSLQVYKAFYTYLKTSDENADDQRWTVIPVSVNFTVDLSKSEIITDNENNLVIVRIEKPVLDRSSLSIDNKNVEILHYQYNQSIGHVNGNYADGASEADDDAKEAYKEALKYFENEQMYFKFARDSAKKQIELLVQSLNPDKELKIIVDFF